MLTHFKNYFFITLLIASGCSSDKKIKDDWPGIGEMSLVNENNSIESLKNEKSFNLNSKISLPKMGIDVSYTVTSECLKDAKEVYKKETSYPAKPSDNITTLDIIDLVADEVLVYPDVFKSCSFKLNAKNQNGSTASSSLNNINLLSNSEDFKIKIDPKEASEDFTLLKNSGHSLSLNQIQNITIESFDGQSLKEPKFICHSKNINTVTLIDPKSERKIIYGDSLKLPPLTPAYPVEHCVVYSKIADGLNKGKTIISQRMSILNRSRLPLLVAATENVSDEENRPGHQLYYSRDEEGVITKKLFTLEVSNDSSDTINFELSSLKKLENITVLEGLKLESRQVERDQSVTKVFSIVPKALPATYSWSIDGINIIANFITLEPSQSISLSLSMKTGFECHHSSDPNNALKHNGEIGLISSLKPENSLFNMKQISDNGFVKSVISSENILNQNSIDVDSEIVFPKGLNNNFLSAEGVNHFFRNSNSSNGVSLSLIHNTPAALNTILNVLEPTTRMLEAAHSSGSRPGFEIKANSAYHDICTPIEL